jgi:hypothetical protein
MNLMQIGPDEDPVPHTATRPRREAVSLKGAAILFLVFIGLAKACGWIIPWWFEAHKRVGEPVMGAFLICVPSTALVFFALAFVSINESWPKAEKAYMVRRHVFWVAVALLVDSAFFLIPTSLL